jgi:hypothetical protein
VKGQIEAHRPLHGGGVVLKACLFNAAQAGGGAAGAGVLGGGVIIVPLPPGIGAREAPLEKGVKVLFVEKGIYADFPAIGLV